MIQLWRVLLLCVSSLLVWPIIAQAADEPAHDQCVGGVSLFFRAYRANGRGDRGGCSIGVSDACDPEACREGDG
jgi:hypothetical protein